MPPPRLTVHDNPEEVALCNWHLRRIFNGESFWDKVHTGQMVIANSRINERQNPSANSPSLAEAPFNEEFIIADATSKQEVARCQRFLAPDGITPVASGRPDPKQINWKGRDYHQLGKDNPECAHCLAGIDTRAPYVPE